MREIRRVLVVDDSEAMLAAAVGQMPDYAVVTESDPGAVLSRVRRVRPDLVILDQWLGSDELTGHKLADEIKLNHPEIVVALWSASFEAVAIRYLQKRCLADKVMPKMTFAQMIGEILGQLDPPEPDWSAILTFGDARRRCAENAVTRCGGNKSEAARRLGVNRTTLVRALSETDQR
jgi:DNA-binding NtrC family response regulator